MSPLRGLKFWLDQPAALNQIDNNKMVIVINY